MSSLEMAFDGRSTQDKADSSSGARRQPATGPFVLRTLLEDVPLSEDGDNDDVKINFVEYLGKTTLQVANILAIGPC